MCSSDLCLRHGDALVVRRAAHRELCEDPAVGEAVVAHDSVTVVVGCARTTESREDGVGGERAEQEVAALVLHGEADVDRGDDLGEPHRRVGIRGRVPNREVGHAVTRAVEPGADGGC